MIIIKKIAAFFDIDGTIARESLMIEHFKRLIKYEIIDERIWLEYVKKLYTDYANRYGQYDAYIEALASKYLTELKGFDVEYNKFIAKQSVDKVCEMVYIFSRNELEFHKKNNHLIFFVSGSPDFLVKEMAKKYDVTEFRATKYLYDKDKKFTGEICPMWDSKSKLKVCMELIEKYNIDIENSFAYGDTTGDLSMLKLFGNAYTINPAKRLLDKIREDDNLKEKVNIIVERKDIIYKLKANVETI